MSGHEAATGATPAASAAAMGQATGCPPTLAPGTQERELIVTAVFTAAKDQVRRARHFAEAMLRDWPVAHDAAFVVSELAANAVLHSASAGTGKFWVHLEAFPGRYVWVEVRDQGGPWTAPGHQDERPHGLDIVGELTADCGVDGDPHTGWIVWARLELPMPAAHADMASPSVPGNARPAVIVPAREANGHAGQPGRARSDAMCPQWGTL